MRIQLMPDSTETEISQNVGVICQVPRGTQPMDRALGIDAQVLDGSGTRGRALLSAAIIETLPEQEPRVAVMGVTYAGDMLSGAYEPVIEYEVVK